MGTLIVGIIVFGVISLAAYITYKDRKNGKGCGGSCECCQGCPGSLKPDNTKAI